MILAGDVGGTKTILALFDGELHVVREAVYQSAEHDSLEAMLDDFAPTMVVGACFGVAGPVLGERATITNLPWQLDARALARQLGGVEVLLVNDLQATAIGLIELPARAFDELRPIAEATAGETISVIAPGTGLGEAVLVFVGGRYHALPSEGGHADFAPGTEEEIELLHFLRSLHGDHVSYERVLSGAGLGDLYTFARSRAATAEPDWLRARMAAGDRNAVISEAALAGTDDACAHALAMFAEILGAEAGNLALRSLARGGVVIGGGIAPKILAVLRRSALLGRFSNKGRFSAWLSTLGVRVALEPRAALLGAARHAATTIMRHELANRERRAAR